jgi:Tfp pilus assembly protein PilO
MKLLLKLNPALWLVVLVGLCYMDYRDWEDNTYKPLIAQIEGQKLELERIQVDLTKIDDFIKNRDAKRAELERAQNEFDAVRKEFPSSPALPALLKSLADITEKLGMEFARFKPGGEVPVDLLRAVQIDVQLQGSYVQIMSFLDSVSNLTRIVNTESLRLVPSQNKENATFKSIDAELKILTYYGDQ